MWWAPYKGGEERDHWGGGCMVSPHDLLLRTIMRVIVLLLWWRCSWRRWRLLNAKRRERGIDKEVRKWLRAREGGGCDGDGGDDGGGRYGGGGGGKYAGEYTTWGKHYGFFLCFWAFSLLFGDAWSLPFWVGPFVFALWPFEGTHMAKLRALWDCTMVGWIEIPPPTKRIRNKIKQYGLGLGAWIEGYSLLILGSPHEHMTIPMMHIWFLYDSNIMDVCPLSIDSITSFWINLGGQCATFEQLICERLHEGWYGVICFTIWELGNLWISLILTLGVSTMNSIDFVTWGNAKRWSWVLEV